MSMTLHTQLAVSLKGLLLTVLTWASTAFAYYSMIEPYLKAVPIVASVVVSFITARYYWVATKKLKQETKQETKD